MRSASASWASPGVLTPSFGRTPGSARRVSILRSPIAACSSPAGSAWRRMPALPRAARDRADSRRARRRVHPWPDTPLSASSVICSASTRASAARSGGRESAIGRRRSRRPCASRQPPAIDDASHFSLHQRTEGRRLIGRELDPVEHEALHHEIERAIGHEPTTRVMEPNRNGWAPRRARSIRVAACMR